MQIIVSFSHLKDQASQRERANLLAWAAMLGVNAVGKLQQQVNTVHTHQA